MLGAVSSVTPSSAPSAASTAPVPAAPVPAAAGSPTDSASSASSSSSSFPQPTSAPASGSVGDGAPGDGWHLAWSDDFDGSTLDPARWKVLDHSTFGDGNHQLECQMANNVGVARGSLTLTAQHETEPVRCGSRDARFPNGRSYTGATVETSGRSTFTYGYIEMRAKFPVTPGSSQGLWPAFWLRPADGAAGEIDVVEAVGTSSTSAKDEAHMTIHHDYAGGIARQTSTVRYPTGALASGYHRYGVDWEPGSITWYIDGQAVWSRSTDTTSWLASTFARPYFLRLNLAVGGSWPGSPDAQTIFPQRYDVDWIRVYQR